MERSIVTIQQPTTINNMPTLAEQEPPTGQQPQTEQPTQSKQEPPKGVGRNIFAGLGYFGIYLLVQVVVGVGYGIRIAIRMVAKALLTNSAFDFSEYMSRILQSSVNMTFVVNIVFLLILWLIFTIRNKNVFQQIRLVPADKTALKQLVPLGLAMNVLISALLMLLPEAWTSSYQDASGMVVGGLNTLTLLLLVALGPIAEEVLFRGLIYTRFARALPRWAAMLCASLLFGLMHGHPIWMIYTGALGFALCLAMEHVHSLWGAIVLHMSFNAGSLIVSLLGGVPPLALLVFAAGACCFFFIRIRNRGPIQPGAEK